MSVPSKFTPRSCWKRALAASTAGVLSLFLSRAEVRAQGPTTTETRTVQGAVRSLTTAPMGEVDGAVLGDGTTIHWPPHLADRFSAVAGRGERVRAVGRDETGPAGDSHLEVQSVTNLRTNASALNDAPPPPPGRPGFGPPPPPRGLGPRPGPIATGEEQTARGTIRSVTTAPMGEIDGAILDDGTVIHWPPHLSGRFSAIASRGERVKAAGRMETGPAGDKHLEVRTITNLGTNATVEDGDAPRPQPGRSEFDAAGADRAAGRPLDREDRLKALEDQIDRLSQEIARLRREP